MLILWSRGSESQDEANDQERRESRDRGFQVLNWTGNRRGAVSWPDDVCADAAAGKKL
jgi:hypothetical protein